MGDAPSSANPSLRAPKTLGKRDRGACLILSLYLGEPMSKEWSAAVAAAETAAEAKQAAEEIAHERFQAVRAEIEAAGKPEQVTESPEFHRWMAARHESDAAWGAWAMAMDAKPAS